MDSVVVEHRQEGILTAARAADSPLSQPGRSPLLL